MATIAVRRRGITLKNQIEDRLIGSKRSSQVTMQDRYPVIIITIGEAVPSEMSLAMVINRIAKEERRPIESMLP